MSHRRICIAHHDNDVASQVVHRLRALGFPSAHLRERDETPLDGVATGEDGRSVLTILVVTQTDEGAHPVLESDGARDVLLLPCTDRELQLTVQLALARHDTRSARDEFEDNFFDVSVDMLCFLGFGGRFQRLNAAWERTLGFTVEELMSRPFIEFVHPDDRERTLLQNASVRAGGQARAFENRYLCKDGSFRWFHWNATAHVTGRVIYSVARDVTEKKAAEEERDRTLAQLREALNEVKTLRAIIPMCAHCRKIRDDADGWHSVEEYIAQHTTSRFSHGICPSCVDAFEPQFRDMERG